MLKWFTKVYKLWTVVFYIKKVTAVGASREKVATEDEGEEEFVFLKERATDVTVEVVGEVVRQVAEPPLQLLRLGTG